MPDSGSHRGGQWHMGVASVIMIATLPAWHPEDASDGILNSLN